MDIAPSAGMLACLAAAEMAGHQPGEEVEPIYLHPAVREGLVG
jgi:hypothetical protein